MLPWQQYSRCQFVSFVMFISGAKFEDHCSNISGYILNSVFIVLVELFMMSSLFSFAYKNLNISKTKKDIPKKKMPLQLLFTS